MWAPEIDALPDDERTQALVACYFLTLSASNIKKSGVLPQKDPLRFNAVVARVCVPFIGPAEEQEAREIFGFAHCLRDGCTAISGSDLTRGPYGDLLYRVMQGCSLVVQHLYFQRVGSDVQIDPANTVRPPTLRLFLDALGVRFADALLSQPSGTTPDGELVATLVRLAETTPDPDLIAPLRDQPPMAQLAHGADWFLSESDLLDMTRDEALAESLANAPAV